MLEKFKSILINDFDNFQGKQLYLAISGGKDSIALSHLLLAAGFSHTLLHCNFQLRGHDSNLDEEFVRNFAKTNDLLVHSIKFETKNIAVEKNLSIQETARNLRYDWFKTFLTDVNDVLLTAHHSDDSIETFFINLMRGTSLQGLTGINNNKRNIARPLLAFNTIEIEDYIKENNVNYRQDQSNFDNKYLRNYLRNQLIPAFQEKSDHFKPKVVKTMQSLKEAHTWIEKQAVSFHKTNIHQIKAGLTVDKNFILKQDQFFLTYILKPFGIHRSNVNSLINALSKSTGAKFLTSSYQFTVNRDQILITERIEPRNNADSANEIPPNKISYTISFFPNKITIDNLQLEFTVYSKHQPFSDNNIQQFDLNQIVVPLTLRPWQHGDRIQPLGMTGTKLISDILIDKKIPLINKSKILVLTDSNKNIIAIPGMLISEKVKIISATTNILSLQLSNTN
ncbi:MAG: tRNA lysidine(34) synthetase TilS [Crocinitomix sp.]|nr:tRNA lysidine(34) synthetase TilS [Crocinitomix sp.]